MGAPFQAATGVASNGDPDPGVTSHVVNFSSVQANDYVLVTISWEPSGTGTVTWPAGWTTGSLTSGAWGWKLMSGGETSITVTTQFAVNSKTRSQTIRDATQAPESTSAGGTLTIPDPPSFSPSWPLTPTLWVAQAGYDLAAGDSSPTGAPSGYTGFIKNDNNATNGSGLVLANRALSAASEDPGAFTGGNLSNGGSWTARTWAFRGVADPQTVAVGLASESESSQAIAILSSVSVAVGNALELEVSETVSPVAVITIAVGVASEVEAAQPVAIITGAIFPSAPDNLTATPISQTQIDLAWDAVTNADFYDIERDSAIIVKDHATTSYSDTGLSPNTQYSYRVRAVKNG